MASHKLDDHSNTPRYALYLGALGVVYGDIGTSPLYAVREAFAGHHAADSGIVSVMGILSMMFWLLMIIVTLKYVFMVLRADNKGEGGNFALLALNLKLTAHRPWLHYAIGLLGILGGCLFYADAVITPAISVLSAVEGINIYYTGVDQFVVPITLTILIILFCCQRFGTGNMGTMFGPITLLWFVAIGVAGVLSIIQAPQIMNAINPYYALNYIMHNPGQAFFSCGAVVLAITGAEALYADMGHFGRTPIRVMWILVGICLVLNYFGQGALILRIPEITHHDEFNPFYMLIPSQWLLPMVVLATAATVIASQATITGAYSITRQAIQLGYLPRLKIIHTSKSQLGQVYLPFVNWMMLTVVILLTVLFRSSSGLASAYGIAVTGTMIVTTIAISIVMTKQWKWPVWIVCAILGVLLMIEIPLFAANMMKIATGGWLPLVIAGVLFTALSTWFSGQRILAERLALKSTPVRDFAENLVKENYRRVPGTAVYMTPRKHIIPEPLMINLKHNKVLHETIILLTIQIMNEPKLEPHERLGVHELAKDLYRITLRYGFMEEPNLDRDLATCRFDGSHLLAEDTTFFLGRESIVPTRGVGMAIWREHIYAWMKRNAGSAADFYRVPPAKMMEIGGQYEI